MMNKIYTNNAPEAIGPYSQAVECGGLIYTSATDCYKSRKRTD